MPTPLTIPGPRSLNPFKISRSLRKNPLAFLTRLTRTYGDISTFKIFNQRYIILNHPDLAKDVLLTQADAFWKGPALQNSKAVLGEGLLTSEGDAHRLQRRLLQPAFHAKHVETYTADVLESTADLLSQWRSQFATASPPHDIRPNLMALTLTIAAKTLFGTNVPTADVATVHRCMDDLMNNYTRTVVPWGKLLNRIPLPSTLRLARARTDLRAVVDRLIATRRHNPPAPTTTRPDLLSMMLAATDEVSPTPSAAQCPVNHSRLTDSQLRDQAITILTASHETTANALTFTLYLLAQHPAEQQKLRASHSPDRARWVLSESMRLLPPAWTLGRQNQRPLTLAGHTIPPKCTVLIPQWTLHRDPRFFPDPDTFLPDRWQNPSHPRHAYFPFSTGPRNCIGESFAWLEMLHVLPLLISAFEFSLPPNTPPLELTPAITLRPRHPVNLLIRPLSDNHLTPPTV